MEQIIVCPAKTNELKETFALFRNILQDLPYYNIQAKEGETKRYSIKSLKVMAKKDPTSVLVAKINDRIVGLCLSYKSAGVFHMDWFGVKKECRHQGIGEAIVKAVVENATREGFHKIICDSRTNNIPSKTFLKKSGFKKFAHVKKHWYKQDFFLWERFV